MSIRLTMQAIVSISDRQFFVKAGDTISVPTQQAEVGSTITFPKVFLTSDGKSAALTSAATVSAKVVAHGKGEKVIVFKKNRRKRYRLTRGHRQGYTQLEITSIA